MGKPKKRMLRLFLKCLVCTIVLVLFYTNQHIASAQQDTKQFLYLSSSSDPKTFNPILSQETSSTQILSHIFEGLVTTDPFSGKMVENLAKTWTVSDDGLEWIFKLRQDVTWSDGAAFTADDVVFTFNDVIYNPNIITGLKSILYINGESIKVSKIDTYTISFTLPCSFAPFLRVIGTSILPKHKLEETVKNNTFNKVWGISTQPEEIIGTGPFVIEQYKSGEVVVLRRNNNYWKKTESGNALPRLEKVYYAIIQSNDLTLLKFRNKELDICGISGQDYSLIKPREARDNFKVFDVGPTMSRSFVAFNQNPQSSKLALYKLRWFQNRNFRIAMAHCINKTQIIDIIFNGFGVPQTSPMSPSSGFYYNMNCVTYEYNLDKAKTILKQEGFIDRDGNGYLEDSEGNEVSFNFYISAGNPQTTTLANLIRKDLAIVGCNVNLVQVEFNTLVEKLTQSYDWDMVLMGLTGGVEPHFGANVWLSSGPLHFWYPNQEEPYTSWERRIDEIFQRGMQELDINKRKALYDEWQNIIATEVPLIFTVIPESLVAVSNRVKNIKPSVIGGFLHNIEELYIDE